MDCLNQIYTIHFSAEWQSGHAADCKSVYAGSIPTSASIFFKRYNKNLSLNFTALTDIFKV